MVLIGNQLYNEFIICQYASNATDCYETESGVAKCKYENKEIVLPMSYLKDNQMRK